MFYTLFIMQIEQAVFMFLCVGVCNNNAKRDPEFKREQGGIYGRAWSKEIRKRKREMM